MVSTPEALREFRFSYSVIYREVVKLHADDPSTLFCLFEGKDSAYYRPRVEQWKVQRAVMAPVDCFDCGGKAAVLRIRNAVDANSSLLSSWCIYFLDRDFDLEPLPARPDTYVTEGYSVEYHYFGAGFFERVAKEIFLENRAIDKRRDTLESLRLLYASLEKDYLHCVTAFNQWAYAVRARQSEARVRFDVFDTMSFIEIDLDKGRVQVPSVIEDFQKAVDLNPPVSPQEIEAAEAWSATANPAKDFRGKQHGVFIISLFEALSSRCRTGDRPFQEKTKISHRLSLKHFLADLGSFADTPKSLMDFLDGFSASKAGG